MSDNTKSFDMSWFFIGLILFAVVVGIIILIVGSIIRYRNKKLAEQNNIQTPSNSTLDLNKRSISPFSTPLFGVEK